MAVTSTDESATSDLVKVWFELPQDSERWPPAVSEGLWARRVAPDVVRLDNTPWFVCNVACGDLVRVRQGDDGLLWVTDKLQWSGHCVIRLIPFRDGPWQDSGQWILDAFAPLGVSGEGIEQYGMVALDVPPDADLAAIRRLLQDGQRDGWWDYEEGCIGDAWEAAQPG